MSDDTAVTPAPARRRRWRRVLLWAVVGLLSLLLAALIGVVWTVRAGFPQYEGELHIGGLSAPVTVYRDGYAIPQLYARTADDLFAAQGYVHAQERFWEMDFRRHVTGGRLAELFGPAQVKTDTFLRTMGWRRVAEREWPLISARSRQYLRAYAGGVNAWLRDHSGAAASLEYAVLGLSNGGYRIAPWDPVDSLAWLKAMAWDLRGNIEDETARAALVNAGLSHAQVEELYPGYPFHDHPPIVTTGTVHSGVFAELRGDGPLGGTDLAGTGSNSWVVSGALTTTGKPILANDPHLSPTMPGVWYQMGLHCTCELNVAGFTFSGVPGVVIGHNTRIAWGFTNLDPDVTDLYLEKLDGDRYQVDGQWRPLEIRHETITVAGSTPVQVTVRSTNNGPLVSDASADFAKLGTGPPGTGPPGTGPPGTGSAVALRWTALDPGRTMDALFALNRAGDWAGFRAAAALFEVPAQNITYADVDGNIGYQAPGRIPVRGKGDGRWPAPGWDSAYDWKSVIPFEALPSSYNPAGGYLVTANQAVVGSSYPYLLTNDWAYGYRSRRIQDLVEQATAGGGKLSVDAVQQMQLDSYNGFAAQTIRRLLDIGGGTPATELLRGWDYTEPANGPAGSRDARSSAAAAYFNAVYRHLLARTFDELPTGYRPNGSDRWWVVLLTLLNQPDSPWWDDQPTPGTERRDDVVKAAMADATDELTRSLGKDPAGWRWGRLHTLTLRNQSFGKSGIGPIEWLFNSGPAGLAGGSSIVNATGWDPAKGYEVTAVPSMRMVVDLSTWDSSRWVALTGESGHAFSDHYQDQFELWRTGRTLPMRWDEPTIRAESTGTLVLRS